MKGEYLNYTDVESWSVEDIINSLKTNPPKKKRIIIPKFQRTVVWKNDQRKALIDSIKKGLPIGAMLLYKVGDNQGITEYLLIDGLQRVTTLKKYYEKPTQFYDESNIDEALVTNVTKFIRDELQLEISEDKISIYLVEWIHSINGFEETDGFSSAELAKYLDEKLSKEYNVEFRKQDIFKLTEILKPHLKKIKEESDIKDFKIPMIVYTGDKKYLPLIFERINSKGTQLNKYQVFAATWTTYKPVEIKNKEIINAIKAKYESLIEEGFEIENYDPETFEKSKFTYFEYLFGFGKLLSKKYPLLFRTSKSEHEADSVGFNIVALCIGHDLRKLDTLPESLKKIQDLHDLESKILNAIEFVNDTLSPFIGIRANKRKKIPVVHTEFQIVAMIGKAFRSRYAIENGEIVELNDWKTHWKKLEKYLPQHYLYEILKGYWSGTGDKKAMERADSDWYEKPIPKSAWDTVLEEWYKLEKSKKEKGRKRINNIAVLFLKYIYTSILTVKDEKSNNFDIDHVISFNTLRPAAEILNGLPISAISNLSLLPEKPNRGSKDKNKSTNLPKEEKLLILNSKIKKEMDIIHELSRKIKTARKRNNRDLQFRYGQELAEHYERYLDLRFEEMKKILFKKTLDIK